ncbi:MAG: Rne/Rng family ribonuclease [Nitrospirae bacterium]|nr:Rne/Rng family ribonuclease [Nitrospirota bacterium]
MKKRILINAIHPEEKRVAIVQGDILVDFYVEASGKEHLKGNIYKGVVVRIEPGLQAAFVDFGQKKQGFLQMREIKPEFYQKKEEGRRARIQDVLAKGQELIVQVEKDERDTKGASLTTYISIPGRYIVMMPGEERVGISRKIESREDRDRLKDIFKSLKLPKDMGFILRTAGSDSTEEELSNDLKYLTKLWTKIQAESKKAPAPALIYKEHDIAVRTIRDYLTSDVTEVLIDDQEAFKSTKEFLRKTLPWRKINIKFYKEKKPIFTRHSIEEQIAKIHERYVYLPSRGYLVIDKTEALTSVDVNSGRSRKEENVESTALKTNLEAADEITRQFRLRDIGGLIVIDFIDMASSKNRREVENRLKDNLGADKAHTEVTTISKFGLVEMTRERMRPAYAEAVHMRCEACGGAGTVKSDEMVAVIALRTIHSRAVKGGIKGVTCKLPVGSLNYLFNSKRDEIAMIEKEYGIRLTFIADAKLTGQSVIDAEKTEAEKKAEEAQAKVHEKPHERPRERRHERRHEKPQEAAEEISRQEEFEEAAAELTAEAPQETQEKPEEPKLEDDRQQKRRPRRRRYSRYKKAAPRETAEPSEAREETGMAAAEPAGREDIGG